MSPAAPLDLATLSLAHFAGKTGELFTLRLDEAISAELALIEARALGAAPANSPTTRAPFALLFRSSDARFFAPQGIYPLQHPHLGTLELFLVPIGPDAVGMRFEAIFN